jgi:antitoxin (DNA-binding transcriptional repressor) of toxin-antitoxin stability system
MTIHIDVAQLGPALVEDLSQNGGEITLTRDGKAIAKLVRVESNSAASSENERVLYKGEWMSSAGAERERAMECFRGSGKILGDIVSPIDDVDWDDNGPMAGTIVYQGDLVTPLDEEWEADK